MHSLDNSRDYSIDWLKTIGTLCLFLAHVDAPFWIKEARGFDVPLMVFLSGMLAGGSFSRASSSGEYIKRRINRLVVPTWIFLVFFYICMAVVNQLPNYLTIIKSFLFQRDGGIAGYTWIILVYIYCSCLIPVLVGYLNNKKISLLLLTIIMIGYELLCSFTHLAQIRILYYTFFTIVPYGTILFIAMNFKKQTKRGRALLAISALAFHTIYAIVLKLKWGYYVPLGEYKYPARFYYISYAIPIIVVLYMFFRQDFFRKKNYAVIEFVSRHSLWIYLWHIFVLAILNFVLKIQNWVICYALLVGLSVGITFMQNTLVSRIERKHEYAWLNYFIG